MAVAVDIMIQTNAFDTLVGLTSPKAPKGVSKHCE